SCAYDARRSASSRRGAWDTGVGGVCGARRGAGRFSLHLRCNRHGIKGIRASAAAEGKDPLQRLLPATGAHLRLELAVFAKDLLEAIILRRALGLLGNFQQLSALGQVRLALTERVDAAIAHSRKPSRQNVQNEPPDELLARHSDRVPLAATPVVFVPERYVLAVIGQDP